MKKQTIKKILGFSGASLLAVSIAQASPVTINNFSFEQDVTGLGSDSGVHPPTGWTGFNIASGSDVGSEYPGAGSYTTPFAAPADGNQYSYINIFAGNPTGGIYQDVGLLAANTTYTLTVAIGQREFANAPGIISLINGTDDTGTVLASTTGIAATPHTFQDFTTTFTTGSVVSGDLSVELSVSTANGGALGGNLYQGDFDNVRLDASPVPEPATIALLGGGLALCLIVLRRKPVSVN